MIFIVSRASHPWDFSADRPPCDGARLGVDPYGKDCWLIEFGDLDAFMAFVFREHQVIIDDGVAFAPVATPGIPKIEIYDAYVE